MIDCSARAWSLLPICHKQTHEQSQALLSLSPHRSLLALKYHHSNGDSKSYARANKRVIQPPPLPAPPRTNCPSPQLPHSLTTRPPPHRILAIVLPPLAYSSSQASLAFPTSTSTTSQFIMLGFKALALVTALVGAVVALDLPDIPGE